MAEPGEGVGYRLGVDIGGTFTDSVLVVAHPRRVWTAKVLTTSDPARGALDALDRVLDQAQIGCAELDAFLHATTLVSNLVVQRRGVRTALITTSGFEEVLELRREVRYDTYDMTAEFTRPVVEREHVFGLRERMLVDGTVWQSVDAPQVRRIAESCRAAGVESIAVSLLHSYHNADHEREVGEILVAELGDGVPVSLSADVSPEMREYERASTTSINAYARPAVARYQAALTSALEQRGLRCAVLVMLSAGGLATPDVSSRFPVRMLESGPAAGALAAASYARGGDAVPMVGLDVGGTTAKACLIVNGEPGRSREFEVARTSRLARGSGLPVQLPSTDLLEIGAGGGSIAHLNALGLLTVGPQSAEAIPGPACYGRGGTAPTVTDANVVLGLIDPERFAGGSMPLRADLAAAAFDSLARSLAMPTEDVADMVIESVNEAMADAVRVHLAERGVAPESVTLLASGGGGPLHASAVARRLGIKEIIIPVLPGVFSALGLLTASPGVDLAHTHACELTPETPWEVVNGVLEGMEHTAAVTLKRMGIEQADIRMRRFVDARWVGQTHTLTVPIPAEPLGPEASILLVAAYNEECKRIFGGVLQPTALEAVTWRLSAQGPRPSAFAASRSEHIAVGGEIGQPRCIRLSGTWVQAPTFARENLPIGWSVTGPALIEESSSTCLVGAGDALTVAENGSLRIRTRQ